MESAISPLTAASAIGITLIAAAVILPSVFMLEWSLERDERRPRVFAVLIAAQHVFVLMASFSAGVAYPLLALPLLALLVGGQLISRALLRMPGPATNRGNADFA